ncbi:MAG: polysaccharide biosynthesis C-terminal domain-containing protein [Oscillospiraceae bacterium]|nr:polysaccharide biosynthesis C-terminal domain-containing protein [Oscillospiraceae bacterium]
MAKNIAKNSFYNVTYKFLNVSFTVIAAAYVSRILMPEGVGKINSAQNIAQYFVLLASLGIPMYGIKAIAVASGNQDETNRVYSELLTINAVSTLICSFVYYGIILIHPFFAERRALYSICGLMIPFRLLHNEWYYQGREEYRYIMMRSLIIKAVMLVFVFLTVRSEADYLIYAFLLVAATEANNMFNFIHAGKTVRIQLKGLNLKRHLRPILALLAVALSVEIYTLADITMLTFMKGDSAVGLYTHAEKGIGVIKMLISAVCMVFLPRLSRHYSSGEKEEFDGLVQKGFRTLFYFAIPATVGIILISEDLIRFLFGTAFLPAADTMRILALSILTVVFSNFIGNQVLIALGKEKQVMVSTAAGACLNVIVNAVLIPRWSINGAAVASVLTQLVVVGVQYYYVRKDVRIRFSARYILSLALGTILMVFGVCLIGKSMSHYIPRLLCMCVTGVAVFCVITLSMKNEVALSFMQVIKRVGKRIGSGARGQEEEP